jgi:predicted nucleic acid-binding protein
MPVASNTSPLLNLAIIGHLSLLHQQFGEIWIPPAVINELRPGEDLPGSHVVREAIEAGWLRVEQVAQAALVKVLQRDLDDGEAEAIALALQVGADWVLLDEREGRRIAKSLGLKVTGVLGVLLRAKYAGQLASLRRAMEQLQNQAGFRIGAELFADVLQKGGEV